MLWFHLQRTLTIKITFRTGQIHSEVTVITELISYTLQCYKNNVLSHGDLNHDVAVLPRWLSSEVRLLLSYFQWIKWKYLAKVVTSI